MHELANVHRLRCRVVLWITFPPAATRFYAPPPRRSTAAVCIWVEPAYDPPIMDDLDRAALHIASQHHEYGVRIEHQIRAAGMKPAEFFHRLDRLAHCPTAEAHDPVTVQHLREATNRSG